MSNFPPGHDTEPKPIDDNARKFIVKGFDPEAAATNGVVRHEMKVYWIDTAEETETKVVKKVLDDGRPDEILHIQKQKDTDGRRTSVKTPISFEEFDAAPAKYPGMPALLKRRTELSVIQGKDEYILKYDEFLNGTFVMVEAEPPKGIDPTLAQEYLSAFDSILFFDCDEEVTGNSDYEGYRIVETLRKLEEQG